MSDVEKLRASARGYCNDPALQAAWMGFRQYDRHRWLHINLSKRNLNHPSKSVSFYRTALNRHVRQDRQLRQRFFNGLRRRRVIIVNVSPLICDDMGPRLTTCFLNDAPYARRAVGRIIYPWGDEHSAMTHPTGNYCVIDRNGCRHA